MCLESLDNQPCIDNYARVGDGVPGRGPMPVKPGAGRLGHSCCLHAAADVPA